MDLESHIKGVAGATSKPGTPGLGTDDGLGTPPGIRPREDLFTEFSSVTLYYDGEE